MTSTDGRCVAIIRWIPAALASCAKMNTVSISSGGSGALGGNERDAYFVEAGKFVIEKQKGSIGMLQRMFKIGFNRAARIMDQLEEAGVVG